MAMTQQQIEDALVEARAAYHDLMLGRMARVVLDQNGERVEFTATNRQQLYLYIQSLERQLEPLASTRPIGPAGFLF